MQFTFVSVALLMLAHSVAPGVHGAPALAFDHANSLEARQDPVGLITSILDSILGLKPVLSTQAAEQLAQLIVQQVQQSVDVVNLRALSSFNSTSSASPIPSTSLSPTTTTSQVLPVATDQTSANTSPDKSSASLSTPSAHQNRIHRQLPISPSVSLPITTHSTVANSTTTATMPSTTIKPSSQG